MTIHFIGCRMTARDYDTCSRLLADLAGGDPDLTAQLRRKLAQATVVSADDIDPLTVTLFSRVEFEVDGEAPQRRILVRCAFRHGLVGLTLPLSVPRGLALLGLRQGQACAFHENGRERTLRLNRVLYQPEAARPRGTRPHGPPLREPAAVIDFSRLRAERQLRRPDRKAPPHLIPEKKGRPL